MRLKRTIILFAVLGGMLWTYASPPFHTKRLAKIAQSAGINLPDRMEAGVDNDTAWAFGGRKLRVRTDAFGDVAHIGYSLFDRSMANIYEPRMLLDFVERYALELDLRLGGFEPAARMEKDGVKCTQGDISLLKQVTWRTPLHINEMERRAYQVSWTWGEQALTLSFPADYQLLSGTDAPELEDIFEREVQRAKPMPGDALAGGWEHLEVSRSGEWLVADEGEYLTKMIRSDLYLKEEHGRRTLVVDEKKPVQSVRNILLTGMYDREIPLHLTINRYGYRNTSVQVSLQQFVSLCRSEGCVLYVGIKSHTEKEISAVLFALNRKMAYNHVLSLRFPLDLLQGTDSAVTATVYAYVPLQNVTEKFFTQDLNEN